MIGKLPYRFDRMERHQLLRRHPKTTVCIPHRGALETARRYQAEKTGFTWREFEDGALSIGHPARPAYDRRWEGVFWTWQRRILHNTGGPVQEWNVRREYRPSPSGRRHVYYSPVDRRIHLRGAAEGWIRIGHILDGEPLGEVRMYDADRDGFFDRWEYFTATEAEPYRTVSAAAAKHVDLGDDWSRVSAFYTETVLPESITENQAFIAGINALGGPFAPPVPANLVAALKQKISPDERRYLLDLIREDGYRHFRREARRRSQKLSARLRLHYKGRALDPKGEWRREWAAAGHLARFETLYEKGDYRAAHKAAEKIVGLLREE
jgi:hypothetical protein